jgi:hypothetical protein
MSNPTPKSTPELLPTERRFLNSMQELGHGRFESMRIHQGQLILDPWPTTVRSVKFGKPTPNRRLSECADFELKDRVAEFFAYVRGLLRPSPRLSGGCQVSLVGRDQELKVFLTANLGTACHRAEEVAAECGPTVSDRL